MVAPVFLGTVTEAGKLVLPDAVKGLLARHLSTLKGKPVAVTVTQRRNKRSDPANRYYFGVVVPLLAEHCGYDRQEMHECLAMRFLRIEDDPITKAPRRKRTPDTDSKEFAEYVDHCRRLAAELGVYIPDPGEAI